MKKEKIGAFPFPLHGRIPNFKGSSTAADMINNFDFWDEAKNIKSNPDSPQRYIRKIALEQGKTVYMAVPKLKEKKCFVKIQVDRGQSKKAASIKGAFEYGKQVHPSEMDMIDLVVTGCVAVNNKGQRIGKGGGYSDLELAILNHFDKINNDTPIITSVHPLQILDQDFPQSDHDIQLDYMITPNDKIECEADISPLPKLNPNLLDTTQLENIPILNSIIE